MTVMNRIAGTLLALAAAGIFATAFAAAPARAPQHPAPSAQPMNKAAIEKIVHDYLVAHPEVLVEMSQALQAKQEAETSQSQSAALKQVGLAALLDPKVAYVTGPANARVTVVEFFDYLCPHCKTSLPAIKGLLGRDKTVRFAFIEFPILTADSLTAAQAAVAARRQSGGKYVAFHIALMASNGELPRERILDIARSVGLDVARLQRDMQDSAVQASIKASHDLAQRLHLDGTPSFIINNKIVVGEVTEAQLSALVKAAGS
jgi:protein-disulfide isomerase